jgi:NAD(P)-dependent dehydrogenase (short-subunit alcohol dehydrogenase family)
LLKMTYQDWKDVMDTNLGGCFNMAKSTFPGMRARGWGRIVNIGSINGQAGQYGQVNYAAAKSGIHGFTKALAQEGAKAGDPGRPPRPCRGNRARRRLPVRRGSWLRHRIDPVDQRRAAHVLMGVG